MKNPVRNIKTMACLVGCLSLLVPAMPLQAQQNQSLELAFDSQVVYGGTPNQTGPAIAAGQTYTVGVGISVPYQGSATVACYDTNGGQLFSITTSTSQQPVTFQYNPAAGPHGIYCSGSFNGTGFNGTVTTGTITFQAN